MIWPKLRDKWNKFDALDAAFAKDHGIKVILVDLGSLDPLYRIIAFILLGIVLLAGAFVYIKFESRLKGIDD